MTGPTPSSASHTEEFRRRLEESRSALLQTLATTDEEVATFDVDEPGGRREIAGVEAGKALLASLGGKERHELDEISDALARLESGTYGLCQRCGRAIALARLRAVPAARHCVDCQRGEDRNR